MLGLFLRPDAAQLLDASHADPTVKSHALEVVTKGYTVIKGAVPKSTCEAAIAAFRAFERANDAIFAENRDANGHYPRIINLHTAFPDLVPLFTGNKTWLAVQDLLFGAPTALYTSIFYETGSQQPMHRDTPVFSTRPEYLYFGNTIYLEPAGDENGCLEVLEGGHMIAELDREAMALRRYGSLDDIPRFDNEIWIEYQDTVTSRGREKGLPIKKLYVDSGDTLIWHPQLPHGGSPIKDPHRTRFSWVIHTTPVGVPVYNQNVFFNPTREFSTTPPWGYLDQDGRKIADMRYGVAFNDKVYPLEQFKAA